MGAWEITNEPCWGGWDSDSDREDEVTTRPGDTDVDAGDNTPDTNDEWDD